MYYFSEDFFHFLHVAEQYNLFQFSGRSRNDCLRFRSIDGDHLTTSRLSVFLISVSISDL